MGIRLNSPPALAKLFGAIDPTLTVINEPKHLTDVGASDFVFNRRDVATDWCEAKDIGKDGRKFAATDYSKAQKERYKNPPVRKFVDWVANKAPNFTATIAKKQR